MTLGARVGLSQDQLANINSYREHPAFTPRERLVLEYADLMATQCKVDDRMYRRLRDDFTEKQIIELAVTVGLSHLINRFHGTFLTQLDE